jgi:hypothetical protein
VSLKPVVLISRNITFGYRSVTPNEYLVSGIGSADLLYMPVSEFIGSLLALSIDVLKFMQGIPGEKGC